MPQKGQYRGQNITKSKKIITPERRRGIPERILIVTETTEGKKHDFKIYNEDDIGDAIPDDIVSFL